jgi:uncharacterized protein (DUF1778 family)
MAATARLEVRMEPRTKELVEYAAQLREVPVSQFVRSAVEAALQDVLDEQERHMVLPGEVFDTLMAWLDEPDEPNDALVRAFRRARESDAEG